MGKDVEQIEQYDLFRLMEWEAFYNLEPFGVDWWILAKLCARVFNATAAKGDKPTSPTDCLPVRPREQTPAEMMAALRSAATPKGTV